MKIININNELFKFEKDLIEAIKNKRPITLHIKSAAIGLHCTCEPDMVVLDGEEIFIDEDFLECTIDCAESEVKFNEDEKSLCISDHDVTINIDFI